MISCSFMIVNRNTCDLLLKCIDHIYKSTNSVSVEIIVVDNGSNDNSVGRTRAIFPEVKIIQAGRNLGFARANNLALTEVAGDYVILVNTDALLNDNCADTLINLLQSDPRIAMAGPQLLNSDGTLQTSYEAFPDLATETLNRSLLKRLFPKKYFGKRIKFSAPTPVDSIIGAVMAIRKSALDQVGGFDERYFFFLEETDLALSFQSLGMLVYHHPSATAVHLQGATAKVYKADARIEFYRSRYLFFEKHYGLVKRRILEGVVIINLTLNVLFWGTMTGFTFGVIENFRFNLALKYELWKWHILGRPEELGLPRV